MRKLLTQFAFLAVIFICSCTKCKQCYLDETNSQTGKVTTTSLGKQCGEELKKIDGKTYMAPDGPAKSYCK